MARDIVEHLALPFDAVHNLLPQAELANLVDAYQSGLQAIVQVMRVISELVRDIGDLRFHAGAGFLR